MKQIKVSLPDELVAAANEQRGLVPLSSWVRALVERELGGPSMTVVLPPGLALGGVIASPSTGRHLHRYARVDNAKPIRHEKGQPVYLYSCTCGAEKEDS